MTIKQEIYKIFENYFTEYYGKREYLVPYNTIEYFDEHGELIHEAESSIEDYIEDYFRFKEFEESQYDVTLTEAFENPSEDIYVLSISWVENGVLETIQEVVARL